MKNNKSLYKSEGINVSDYKEYEGGYKVIDFSSDKSNKYGSKNVVFDKNNKELEVSENDITIIDKKLIVGKESSYSMSLYSVKNNKMISYSGIHYPNNKNNQKSTAVRLVYFRNSRNIKIA